MNIYGDSVLKRLCPLLEENGEKEKMLSLIFFLHSVLILKHFIISINFYIY